MDKFIQKITKNKKVELSVHKERRSPTVIYINPDEKCNEDCVFCVVKGQNNGVFGSMNITKAQKTISDFVKNGGEGIVFTGGEPTLRDDLPKIIRYAEKFKGIQSICIITNGVRLSDKKYFNDLLKADFRNILNFSVSLHSHKENISEQLTRLPNSFNRTINGIKNIIAHGRSLTIYQVITTKNYKNLYAFARFLSTNFPKIKIINLAYPFPQGNAVDNDWLFPKISDLRPHLIKTLRFFEKKGYKIIIASCGQFPLCAIPGFEEAVISSLNSSEEKTFGVIGNKAYHDFEMAGDEFQQLYKNKDKLCRKCIFNNVCQGFWKKYIELFNFDGIRPVTALNFKGNKIKSNLQNNKELDYIIKNLNPHKVNLIQVGKFTQTLLESLVLDARQNKILVIIIDRNKQILYS
ncbi:MAG TPA: radical SAM protein [Candidatus Paceibacterota bacterium]|nr:radical SAM protein [Candidatus Paceibacterota bacterium]HPR91142.1 radical SAM protein [Candidatus Paceibacterota bacterium]